MTSDSTFEQTDAFEVVADQTGTATGSLSGNDITITIDVEDETDPDLIVRYTGTK